MRWLKSSGQKGSTIVLTALLLPLLIGITGVAVDIGNLYIHKASLQNATDAAVLAGGHAYAENAQSTSATEETIDDYLKKNTQLKSTYKIHDLTYKTKNEATRITLVGEETVPLHFLPLFGIKSEQLVTATSTAKVAYTGSDTPRIFEYAMIGGYKGTPRIKDGWNRMGGMNDILNAIVFHSCNIDIKGKVHVNGPVYLDDNHFITADEFSCLASKDSELWSNYRDNYWEHYLNGADSYWVNGKQYFYDDMDEATRKAHIRPKHENDEKIPDSSQRGYTWRYYYRMSNDKKADYTGQGSHSSEVDISYSKSNPMTSSLYDTVQRYQNMSLAQREAAHVYLDVDSNKSYQLNPSHTTSIYPGLTCGDFKTTYPSNLGYKVWDDVYKVVIVNGDLIVNIPANQKPDNEADHLLLVSLNGNISMQNSSPFYGYVYAPNGTVLIDGSQNATIYGSVVAKSVFLTTGGQQIHATHKTFTDGTGSGKGGTVSVSLVSDDDE